MSLSNVEHSTTSKIIIIKNATKRRDIGRNANPAKENLRKTPRVYRVLRALQKPHLAAGTLTSGQMKSRVNTYAKFATTID